LPINRVLVANRGEIALRVIRACEQMNIETVLAASAADMDSLPARRAGRCICIGPPMSAQSYLSIDNIVMAAQASGCDAVHPGYGFLSESPAMAQACVDHKLIFVGPRPDQILAMGNKLLAREQAGKLGLPMLPGSQKVRDSQVALEAAHRIGYPVMLKAAAGGGGRGMKIVTQQEQLQPMFESASNEARAAFGDETLYLERYIANARHIEVQVLGDAHGNVVHLGERDCSLQRRHQKLVEESPAPGITETVRDAIRQAALTLARSMDYQSAGTVEFIYDEDQRQFYFLEMNTRIQVEHPVTELVTGIDLVQEQLRVAMGERLRFSQSDVVFRGHAVECRINAEVPGEGFRPSPGRITKWHPPDLLNLRLDSHCHEGYMVPPYYDSMIGKLIAYGTDREEALSRMENALTRFAIGGIGTTREFLAFVMSHPDFKAGRVNTTLVDRMAREFGARFSADPRRMPPLQLESSPVSSTSKGDTP
jgi:acetyl-CoA carboxylase biotin carboxylase subunit